MNSIIATSSSDLTNSEVEAVRRPLETANFLPPRVYADPKIFDNEINRVFKRAWLPFCHISQLTEPGDYVSRVMFGEPVVATRDKSGEVHVMSNVCRHRNSLVASGSGKCRGNRLTCPYHGWAYGLDGKLLAAPMMEKAEGFNRTDISLPAIRHEIWEGFIFINFDEKADALAPQVATLTEKAAPYQLGKMKAIEVRRAKAPWNWKVSMENFTETYHQPFIHPVTANRDFPAPMSTFDDSDGPWSMFWMPHHANEKTHTLTPPVADMPDDYYRAISVMNIYPLFHMFTDSANPLWMDWEISGVEDTELVWYMLVPEEHVNENNIEHLKKEFLNIIEPILVEDVEVCRAVSQGVKSSMSRPGRLSHLEKSVHQFQNWWLNLYQNP